jgi:N,N'-diacetylchitobiose transport system permease protein
VNARFPAVTAAEARVGPRRRRFRLDRLGSRLVPYALIAPTVLVVGAVLGYPLYLLVKVSFERYDLPQLIQHRGVWIGLDNYTSIIHDSTFWHVTLRTILFTAANVGLTMLFGTLIALLLVRLGAVMRFLLTTGLVLVWAIPPVVSVNIWRWLVDYEFGVVNWTLTKLHFGNFDHHDWFANPYTGLAIIVLLIVWGAIPFVAITLYAGLSQVPSDLVEAASIDGANPWRVFRDVTFPILKPIFVILTSLSIIWDFQVFTQIWVMLDARPGNDYFTMGIYSFTQSFRLSEYGLGSAIAVAMVLIMLAVSFFYIREMVRIGEVDR